MKKVLKKKLRLNKVTVSSLNKNEKSKVNGGIVQQLTLVVKLTNGVNQRPFIAKQDTYYVTLEPDIVKLII